MRVENNGSVNPVSGVRPRNLLPVEESTGSSLDSVAFSTRAADIRVAMEALQAAPEVREERVAEIAGQLQQGTLIQDGSAVAARLLEQP